MPPVLAHRGCTLAAALALVACSSQALSGSSPDAATPMLDAGDSGSVAPMDGDDMPDGRDDAPIDGSSPAACTTSLAALTCPPNESRGCCPPSFGGDRDLPPTCPPDPVERAQSGPCGDVLALERSWGYTGISCYYASGSHALVGAVRGSDVSSYCNDTSFAITAGVVPPASTCQLAPRPSRGSECPIDAGAGCGPGVSAEECARCGPATACNTANVPACTPPSAMSFACCGAGGGSYCACFPSSTRWQVVVCDPPQSFDAGAIR